MLRAREVYMYKLGLRWKGGFQHGSRYTYDYGLGAVYMNHDAQLMMLDALMVPGSRSAVLRLYGCTLAAAVARSGSDLDLARWVRYKIRGEHTKTHFHYT